MIEVASTYIPENSSKTNGMNQKRNNVPEE